MDIRSAIPPSVTHPLFLQSICPFHPSVCPSILPSFLPSFNQSAYLSVHHHSFLQSIHPLSVRHLSILPSIHLAIDDPSFLQSIIHPFIHLSICPSICPSVVCLSIIHPFILPSFLSAIHPSPILQSLCPSVHPSLRLSRWWEGLLNSIPAISGWRTSSTWT